MRKSVWAYAQVIALVAAGFGCGGGEKCFRDENCSAGFRCELGDRAGEGGECEKCDGTEIPYDALDNDCDPQTRDFDLDRDGDNAKTASINPGNDCDDNEAQVSSLLAEVCEDGKDNNCNGSVDEPACGDLSPPTVFFVRPMDGATLSGNIDVEIGASDDVAVESVELFAADVSQGRVTNAPYVFRVDTTQFPDGLLELRAVATDVSGKSDSVTIEIGADNRSGPLILVMRPVDGQIYGGRMTAQIRVTDAQGVSEVRISLDQATLTTTTANTIQLPIDTTTLTEGPHVLEISGRDLNGATSFATINFVTDNEGPAVTIMPNGGQLGGTVDVVVTATDATGLASLEAAGRSTTTGTLMFNIDTLMLPNGGYTITATASDTVVVDDGARTGNVTIAQARFGIFNAENEPPAIEILSPLSGESVYRSFPIEANATSPSSVEKVEFFVNGRKVYDDPIPPYRVFFDFSRYVGNVLIEAKATDGSGRIATDSSTVTVIQPANFRVPFLAPALSAFGVGDYDVGDFTGDGQADIAFPGIQISFSVNQGGFFGAPQLLVNQSAANVAIGDMNGDRLADLVVLRSAAVDVWQSTGAGFDPPRSFSIGNVAASCIALGDLDGDGATDVVLGRSGQADLLVMQNRGGSLADVRSYGLVAGVSQVVLADIDNDMDADVVVARLGQGLDYFSVYVNDGRGGLGAARDSFVGGQPEDVAVADVTGDGYPDVVGSVRRGPRLNRVVIAAGDPRTPGFFNVTNEISVLEPNGAAIGDLDRDGIPDIVASSARTHTVSIIERRANGVFEIDRRYAIARSARRPLLRDVDADGDLDVIAGSSIDDLVAVAINLGNGELRAPYNIPLTGSPSAVKLGQFGGDARPDPVFGVVNNSVAYLSIYETRTGTITRLQQFPTATAEVTGLAVGDLDRTGGADIAVGSAGQNSGGRSGGALFLDDGSTSLSRVPVSLEKPRSVVVADVNGDGLNEAVFTFDRQTAGPIDGIALVGDTGAIRQTVITGDGAQGVVVGNLDTDGVLDVGVANFGSDDLTIVNFMGGQILRRTIGGIQGNASITFGFLGPTPVDAAPDLLAAGLTGVGIWLGDGRGGFSSPSIWSAGQTPAKILSGDFNRDGLTDAVVVNSGYDLLSVLIARERGGLFGPDVIAVGEGPTDVDIGDIDGNGQPDIVVAVRGSNSATIILNDN
jgi:hypothetical protein